MTPLIFYKLSDEFYNKKNEEGLLEVLENQKRPYLDGTIITNNDGLNYFIPIRSNINQNWLNRYPELYVTLPTPDKPNAGLDLRKTIIISDENLEKFVSIKTGIKSEQYRELLHKLPELEKQLNNYISDYRQYPNREKYKIGTLQYFHKELGIDEELAVEKSAEPPKSKTQLALYEVKKKLKLSDDYYVGTLGDGKSFWLVQKVAGNVTYGASEATLVETFDNGKTWQFGNQAEWGGLVEKAREILEIKPLSKANNISPEKATQETTQQPTQINTQEPPSGAKKKFQRLSDEMITQANNTSILDYVAHYGIPVKKNSQDEYELVDSPNIKFSVKKNLFTDYNAATQISGGVISFAKHLDGRDDKKYYPNAVRKVLAVEGSGTFEVKPQEPFKMPNIFTSGDMKQAMPYLVNERKLESQTIKTLAESGLIKQTKNGEVAFIWADGPNDVGMTIQGTKPYVYTQNIKDIDGEVFWQLYRGDKKEAVKRGIAKTEIEAQEAVNLAQSKELKFKKMIYQNSTSGHGFNFRSGDLTADKGALVLAESPIDLISYCEMNNDEFENINVVYQSLEGVKEEIAVRSLERYQGRYGKLPEVLIIATDNDNAGNDFDKKLRDNPIIKKAQESGMRVRRDMPKVPNSTSLERPKDWNDAKKQVRIQARMPINKPVVQSKAPKL